MKNKNYLNEHQNSKDTKPTTKEFGLLRICPILQNSAHPLTKNETK